MIANNQLYLCSDEAVIMDSNYRYKVNAPEYDIKTKKGKQITYITNSVSLANSLEWDHELLVRLIGQALSCKSSVDKDLRCAAFQGIFRVGHITDIICYIVQCYMLCQSCDKPEVVLYRKKRVLKHACKACGVKQRVNEALETTNMYDTILKHFG